LWEVFPPPFSPSGLRGPFSLFGFQFNDSPQTVMTRIPSPGSSRKSPSPKYCEGVSSLFPLSNNLFSGSLSPLPIYSFAVFPAADLRKRPFLPLSRTNPLPLFLPLSQTLHASGLNFQQNQALPFSLAKRKKRHRPPPVFSQSSFPIPPLFRSMIYLHFFQNFPCPAMRQIQLFFSPLLLLHCTLGFAPPFLFPSLICFSPFLPYRVVSDSLPSFGLRQYPFFVSLAPESTMPFIPVSTTDRFFPFCSNRNPAVFFFFFSSPGIDRRLSSPLPLLSGLHPETRFPSFQPFECFYFFFLASL